MEVRITPRPGLKGLFEGFRVWPRRTSRGHHIVHSHPHVELHYCERGQGYFEIVGSGQKHILAPGRVTLILGTVTHRVFASVHTPYVRSVLHFPPGLATSGPRPPVRDILSLLPTSGAPFRQYALSRQGELRLQELLELLYAECAQWTEFSRLRVSHILECTMQHIMKAGHDITSPKEKASPYDEWLVHQIETMMAESDVKELTVQTLAGKFGISQGHLLRIYQRVRGRSLRDDVLIQRFSMADSHLRTGASITMTAHACHYSDVTSFSKSFKRYMGITPSIYRQWVSAPS